mmetsp:Transcript_20878/g.53043  ORF Transcript_20878/g.53043 Transcript_20878/m.53043 type:complete len:133 (-) Transcript_20878:470-868(-)
MLLACVRQARGVDLGSRLLAPSPGAGDVEYALVSQGDEVSNFLDTDWAAEGKPMPEVVFDLSAKHSAAKGEVVEEGEKYEVRWIDVDKKNYSNISYVLIISNAMMMLLEHLKIEPLIVWKTIDGGFTWVFFD